MPCSEVDNRPDWSLNDNVINLDEDTAIDVPPEWSSTDSYRASLGVWVVRHHATFCTCVDARVELRQCLVSGHKANHVGGGRNNCEYDRCFHPRFGNIKYVPVWKAIGFSCRGQSSSPELFVLFLP